MRIPLIESEPHHPSLVDWYESERHCVSSRAKRAAAAVWIAVATTVVQLLASFIIFQFVVDGFLDYLYVLLMQIWFALIAIIALTVWIRTQVGVSSVRGLLNTDPKDIPDISEVVERLCQNMNLPISRITYWLSIQPGSASVVTTKSSIRLRLSVNVLADAKRNPAAVRGLLAHELAHVRHQDTNVWWTVNRIAVPLRAVLAVMIGVSILITALMSVFSHGWPWNWDIRLFTTPNFIPYVLTLLLSYAIKSYQKAEVLADFAAVLATSTEDVRAALKQYVPEDDEQEIEHEKMRGEHGDLFDNLHPTRTARLARLHQFEESIQKRQGNTRVCSGSN